MVVFVVGMIVSELVPSRTESLTTCRSVGLMASRPLLVALLLVIAVMVGSWMLGEYLRQRKDK